MWIETLGELATGCTPYTLRCLEFARDRPEKRIPVFPDAQGSPEEAEKEARALVAELREIKLDGENACPVFHVCHVERDKIWLEFSLNPDFVEILGDLK